MRIISKLAEVWEAVPEVLKTDENYCFHVGDDWDEIPKTFKGKKVVVFSVSFIPKESIYYSYKIIYEEQN